MLSPLDTLFHLVHQKTLLKPYPDDTADDITVADRSFAQVNAAK